jgi:hypothetical protein
MQSFCQQDGTSESFLLVRGVTYSIYFNRKYSTFIHYDFHSHLFCRGVQSESLGGGGGGLTLKLYVICVWFFKFML